MQFITTYLTANEDPQRGVNWDSNASEIDCLSKSVGHNLTVLHDEKLTLCPALHLVKVEPIGNPYFSRWEHLLNNLPASDFVCILDATDTELLNKIPDNLDVNKLYVGHEQSTVGSNWMLEISYTEYMKPFIDLHASKQLLNCGVVIGHVDIVREFLVYMVSESHEDVGVIDMGLFNKVMYERFHDRFEYGNHITTQFKQYEYDSKSWVRHK